MTLKVGDRVKFLGREQYFSRSPVWIPPIGWEDTVRDVYCSVRGYVLLTNWFQEKNNTLHKNEVWFREECFELIK